MSQDFINLAEKYCDIEFIKETLSGLESVKRNKERIKNGQWEDYFKEKQVQYKQSGMSEEDVTLYTDYAQKEKLKDVSSSKEMYGKLFLNGECVFKTKARQKVDKKGQTKHTKAPELSVIAYSIILDRFYDEFVAFTNDEKLKALVKRLNADFTLSLPCDWFNASKQLFNLLVESDILQYLAEDVRKMAINKIGWRMYCHLIDRENLKWKPYNLILTGAPGTGKTYLAKNKLAENLVMANGVPLTDEIANDQVGFVQFHPSYDYSDFIEGLRPIKDNSGKIGFERKDGVFKSFCEKALLNPSKTYVFIIDEINRGEMSKIFGELFFSIDPGYRGTDGRIKTQYANLTEHPNDFDKALGITEQKDVDGNVINTEDFGHFFVPKNVYIIGTMNDIDRSVESMDFAMRRRFVFKEVKAEDRIDMWSDKNQLSSEKKKLANSLMRSLNCAIEKIPGLTSAYHIGPSYFLKLKECSEDELWSNSLYGLLYEYLRGMPNADALLVKLHEVYSNAASNQFDGDLQAGRENEIKNKMNS